MLYSSVSNNQYIQFLRLRGVRPPPDSIYMYFYSSWCCKEMFKCVFVVCACGRRLAGRSHGGVRMSGSSHGGGGRTLPAWTGPGLPAWQWGSVKCTQHTVREKVLKIMVSVSHEKLMTRLIRDAFVNWSGRRQTENYSETKFRLFHVPKCAGFAGFGLFVGQTEIFDEVSLDSWMIHRPNY